MTLIYNFCFIFTFCFLFGNLAWLNVKVSRTSKEVNVLSQVVQDMYFRNYWIKITLREVHYWQAYVDQWEDYEEDLLTDAFLESFQNLRTASKSLINSTSQLNEDLQALFYQKRVKVFTQNGSEFLQDSSKFDTFQTTSLLFSNMFQLADFITVQDVSQEKFDQTVLRIVDNSMNDLLLVSNDLTEKVRAKLFDAIKFAKEELQCIFIGYALDIILFIFLSFVLVIKRNKASQKFVDIFTTLSPSQIGSIKNNLIRFRALLNEGSNYQAIDAYSRKTKSKKRLTAPPAPHRKSHNHANISLRKLYQRNFFILFALVLCLAITLGFALIYYHQAMIKINGVEKQQINLISALTYLNTISIFNAGLQSMLLFNNITTIEGVPITTALLSESQKLLDVTDFQESLTNADGSLPKYQWDLLYNIDCEDLHSKYNPWSVESLHYACSLIADGTGQVSFMKTFLQLNSVVKELVQRFANSDRSLASRKPIYSDFYNYYYCYGDVTNVMLFMSFEYSTNNFSEMVKELGDKSKTLAYLAFVVCGFLGVVTWVFVIRKLSRMEFERKKMLALIPDKYLFANFLMKRDLGFAQ